MENYEKLLILLEMKEINISPFVKMKKNELLLSGCKGINKDITYYDLINNYVKYLSKNNAWDNPFFSNLGPKKHPSKIDDIIIHNYKNNTYQKISDILFSDDLIDSQKQDIIYRGFQQLCNEYKNTLNSIVSNDLSVINSYFKTKEMSKINPNWYKKRNLMLWFCSILLMVFNYFFIRDSNIVENKIYYYLYNVIFNLLVFIPFIKIGIFYYLNTKLNYSQKKLNYLKIEYDIVKDLNDKYIDKLEKDLYFYYSNTSKSISITYLAKTNNKLKKVNKEVKKIMNNK